jgi:hypothetical protein
MYTVFAASVDICKVLYDTFDFLLSIAKVVTQHPQNHELPQRMCRLLQ